MEGSIKDLAVKYGRDKKGYGFFDINCWWDYTADRMFRTLENFSQLNTKLLEFGIKKAVVTSVECLKYDPVTANDKLAENIKDYENLYGCMVLVPELAFFGRDYRAYIDKKLREGFVCARMFPKLLRHSMKDWLVGDILEYLAQRRIPLILWHNEVSWDYIQALASQHKNLPVIIEGNDVKLLYHTRNYVPLLERYENIYLETHNVVLFGELDFLAEMTRGEKLLFGSYYPYNTPDATMFTVTQGRFSEQAGHQIAGENLEKLIAGIK